MVSHSAGSFCPQEDSILREKQIKYQESRCKNIPVYLQFPQGRGTVDSRHSPFVSGEEKDNL